MDKHRPLPENEIQAAEFVLGKRHSLTIRFRIDISGKVIDRGPGVHDRWDIDSCPACPADSDLHKYRHRRSLKHISYTHNIPLSRLRQVVKVVKVMGVLDDKPEEYSKWKKV